MSMISQGVRERGRGFAHLRLIALMALFTVLFVACGGGADDTGGGSQATEPQGQDTQDDGDQATSDETFTLRFTTIFGPETPLQQQMTQYQEQVTERTNGRVEWENFYGASLVGAQETVQAMTDGRVETGYVVPAYAPADFPLWNVTFVPVPGANSESITRAQQWMVENSEVLQEEFEANGVKMLQFVAVGDLGTVATPDPITDISGLEGLSIRALGYLADALSLVGADPVVIEAQETFESLQRGVLDGAGGFAMDVLVGQGLQEVAPWMLKLDIGQWVGAGLGISLDQWNQLPTDIQEVMIEVGEESIDNSLQVLEQAESEACDALLDAGGGVTVLPDAQSADWRDMIGDSLWEKWRSDASGAGATEEQISTIEQQWRNKNDEFATESDFENGLDRCAERTEQ